MCLADDLMEPFRPLVDLAVYQLLKEDMSEVTPETKKILASVMNKEIYMQHGVTALKIAVQSMTSSLGLVFEGKSEKLLLPKVQPPLLMN